MKDDGQELKKLQDEHDINILEIALEADLNPQTIYKVYRNEASRRSANRVRKALNQLLERQSSKVKAVG